MSEKKELTLDEMLAMPIPRVKKRKVVIAEVGERMHEAVKAKPEKLRMIAEDEHGNTVIERPYRASHQPPQSVVPDGPHSATGEIRWKRRNEGWDHPKIGNPYWDERFGRSSYPDESMVVHEYDPVAVLRREFGDE